MTRKGFTLIEVLVAILLAGLTATMAAAIFATTSDMLAGMNERSQRWDREANGWRWLGEALASLEVDAPSGYAFTGTSESMRFRTMLWVSDGWREPTVLTVAFDGSRVTGRASDGTRIIFADSIQRASFDYLADYGASSPWFVRWDSSVSAPIAIRVRAWRIDSASPLSA